MVPGGRTGCLWTAVLSLGAGATIRLVGPDSQGCADPAYHPETPRVLARKVPKPTCFPGIKICAPYSKTFG